MNEIVDMLVAFEIRNPSEAPTSVYEMQNFFHQQNQISDAQERYPTNRRDCEQILYVFNNKMSGQ